MRCSLEKLACPITVGAIAVEYSVPARLEEPVESELPSPLPLPCIYTPKSPYEYVGLGLVGLSHSPQANESAGKGFEERRAATCSMKCL